MKRIAVSISIAASLLLSPAFAQDKVYKWTDENGVVHFSKTPPDGGNVEQVQLRKGPPAPATDNSAGDTSDQELFAEADQPDNRDVERANRERSCQKGRNMLAQIEPRPRVFRVDAEGNRTYLSDQERLDMIEEARKLVADNCD